MHGYYIGDEIGDDGCTWDSRECRQLCAEVQSVTAYLERLQLFIIANSIPDEKKVSMLLSMVGATINCLLRSLVAPALPQDKMYA